MKQTQTAAVLQFMEEHPEGITSLDAFELFGATRLSSLIYSLRKQGYIIESIEETCQNRFGGTSRFARCILKGKVEKENYNETH